MKKLNIKAIQLSKHKRILRRIREGNEHLRLRVLKTNSHIYLYVINDLLQRTIASSSSLTMKLKNGNLKNSQLVAEDLLKKLQKNKITNLSFDRGIYKYHGKIANIAEYLRKNQIKI